MSAQTASSNIAVLADLLPNSPHLLLVLVLHQLGIVHGLWRREVGFEVVCEVIRDGERDILLRVQSDWDLVRQRLIDACVADLFDDCGGGLGVVYVCVNA